jgi:hypothetical protein
MKPLLFTLSLCFGAAYGFAQNIHLDAKTNIVQQNSTFLARQFESYSQFSLNTSDLFQELNAKTAAPLTIKFNFPGFSVLETELNAVELLSDDFTVLIQTEAGVQVVHERPAIYTYQGRIAGYNNSKVALTISKEMLSGFFDLGDGNRYYIEPVKTYDPQAAKDIFVLYNASDVLESNSDRKSLAKEVEHYGDNKTPEYAAAGPSTGCVPKKLEIGIANDYQMVLRYGSAANVIAHDLTVINAAQTNYDNEFIHPLRFKVASIFVSSCATCDPWSLTSDYDLLFTEFADWLNAGGFMTPNIDWAVLLTPREIDGNISGYTFPNGMCEYYRASLIINYTDILCKLQKHVAHAIGISFGASQTATGIMKPGGICTNDWEPVSITQINNAILTKPCLSTCVAQPPAAPYELSCLWTFHGEKCFTFDNPCVASFDVSTDDPTLQVTTNGTTICVKSLVEGQRTSHVYVFARDFCGRISMLGVSWTVEVDCHAPNRNTNKAAEQSGELSITQNNESVIIADQSTFQGQKLIQIFDVSGKLVLEQADASTLIQVPLQALPAGLYMVRVRAGEKVITSKILHF